MPDIGNPEGAVHNPTQEVQAQAERLEQMSAEEVTREIRDNARDERLLTRAAEVEALTSSLMPIDGDLEDPTSNKAKAREALGNAQKIILAARQGKIPIPENLPPEAQEFVRGAIATYAATLEPELLDDRTGAFVYSFFAQLIDGDVPNIDVLVRAVQSIAPLSRVSPRIFQKASDATYEVAESNGISQEELVQRFAPQESIQDSEMEAEPEGGEVGSGRTGRRTHIPDGEMMAPDDLAFEHLWQQYLQPFYDDTDREVLRAMTSVDNFASYVKKLEADEIGKYIADNNRGVASREAFNADETAKEEVGRRVSEDFEREVVLKFSKLFLRVDTEKPTEFWEQIIQQGYYDSIQIVSNTLKRRMELLLQKLPDHESFDELSSIKFFKSHSVQTIGEKTFGEGDSEKTHTQYRIVPSAGKTEVGLREYLRSVTVQMDHEMNTRAYLHNVKALFYQGASGDETFWGKLGGYAQQFSTTDIDAMMLLPDSDIFMTAQRLYAKYVEEAFAEVDWIHQPNMFSTDLLDNYSKIEQSVFSDLKKMHPKIEDREDWRLRRAMSMAIGLSRGVLMTEAESAAWADPNVTVGEGGVGPTFASYYTNDSAALNALNPLHHFMRWQTEGVIQGPLLFLQAGGYDEKQTRIWDHNDLWNQAEAYKKSWVEGSGVFNKSKDVEKLFIELLPNIGKVGSLVSRGGWRYAGALEGWMQREGDGKLKILESWKAIENIGFQAAFDFVNANIDGKIVDPKFMSYLFDTYINEGGRAGSSFADYWVRMRGQAESEIRQLIRTGDISAKEKDVHSWLVDQEVWRLRAENNWPTDKEQQTARKKAIKQRIETDVQKNRLKEETVNFLVEKEVTRQFAHQALAHMIRQRMPTKFIRIERSRHVKDGIRAWEKIRRELTDESTGKVWSPEKMDNAMKLLLQVEARVREQTSAEMKDYLKNQNPEQYELANFQTDNYKIDEDRIREVLGARHASDPEVADAVKLFNQIGQFTSDEYLKKFAEKMRYHDIKGHEKTREFPFALGTEELDMSFYAYRNAGPSVLARALNDTGRVEKDVVGNIMQYVSLLKKVSTHPEKGFEDLVKHLELAKKAMDDIHGKGYAEYVVFHMAALTIAYFKKDTVAKNLLTKAFTAGKKNSLAAEFIPGPFRGVWEWEASDIQHFMRELERGGVLSKQSKDLAENRIKVRDGVTVSLLGRKLTVGAKYKSPPASPYSTKRLAKEMGGSPKHLTLEAINKWIPILMALVLYSYITRALKEASGNSK